MADPALIDPSPYQPRRHVNQEQRAALRESIARSGLVHAPLARRTTDGRYELVAGHQRRDAIAELLGARDPRWPHAGVPLDVRRITDEQAAAIALEENTQREDLLVMEQVRAWRRMIDEIPGMTQEKVAELVGKDRATVANLLRLLGLPGFVLELVDAGRIKPRAARELLALRNEHQTCEPELFRVLRRAEEAGNANTPDELVRRLLEGNDAGRAVREDFSSGRLRDLTYQVITESGSRWRPMEQAPGGPYLVYGRAANLPAFDVERFKAQFPASLFRIPAPGSDKVSLWTNEGDEWLKRQTAAKRVTREAAKAAGEPLPGRSASSGRQTWQPEYEKLLAVDPVVRKEARARVPKGTFDPAHPDPEVMKAAGTRGEPVKASAGYARATFERKLGPRHNDDERPPYFDDRRECETCTKGARYVQSYAGVALVCSNKECFSAKADKGRSALVESFEAACAERDQQVLVKAEAMRVELERLPSKVLEDVATGMIAGRRFTFETFADTTSDLELPYDDQNLGEREPAAYRRTREELGLERPDGYGWRGRNVSFLGGKGTIAALRGAAHAQRAAAVALIASHESQPPAQVQTRKA